MAKKGMKRPQQTHTQPRNDVPAVPEIHGKAKHGGKRANPVIGGAGAQQKSIAQKPLSNCLRFCPVGIAVFICQTLAQIFIFP